MPIQENLIGLQFADGSSTRFAVFENHEHAGNAVAVLFPAMGTKATYYRPFAQSLAEKGITAVTADLRGLGNSSVRPRRGVDFGFNEMLELEYKGIVEKTRSLFPGRKIYIIGHSLGGILGSLFLSKYPREADGLILIAACNIWYKGWGGIHQYGLLFGTQLMNFFAALFGYHAGNIVGFGGIGAKTVIHDWSYTARRGKYKVKKSAYDFENGLNSVAPNILAISFSDDRLSPKRAVENLLGKFNPASKILHNHLSVNPEISKPYSHYNWVKYNRETSAMVAGWIKQEN